jgi:hypothetical protein
VRCCKDSRIGWHTAVGSGGNGQAAGIGGKTQQNKGA